MANDIILERGAKTDATLDLVRSAFRERLGTDLDEHTTIYATGSCGRGDMGAASDLDPYVVRLKTPESDPTNENAAKAIALALEAAVRDAGLPELDGDGEYAELVTAESLFGDLGNPKDDELGFLTKRMLLLLESRPLVNAKAYETLLELTVNAYWKNEDAHPTDYLPFVLVNDIVRYWRIVLLNHESRLREKIRNADYSNDDEMALRRYSSYKLRIPRCLSCFSALAYLLALTPSDPAHVDREDIVRMAGMPPINRLNHIAETFTGSKARIADLRRLYVCYLERTNGGKTALTDALKGDPSVTEAVSHEGPEFARQMFHLIQELGGGRPLHRAIVV